MNEDLDHELHALLIRLYGESIRDDIGIICEKISAIIAAHLYAGELGNNPLCMVNRALRELIK